MASRFLIKSRYEVRSVLGRGGMGVVYQAHDTLMRRDVAIKTLRDVPSSVFIDLFYRECSVLAGMVHPNVVEVFDMGEFEEEGVSKPYFVMPLLPGRTLHDLLYPSGLPLSVLRGVDIISQCCRGLQAAHDRGLLHRDIKPRNIFVMGDDSVKVIDFGIAHLMGNNTTGVRGTPQYMSPEQITFKPLNNRSDVFSLATVAYETLTGTHPFLREAGRQDSDADIASAIITYNPPIASELNPAVSRSVGLAISKAMMKDSRARFESTAAFAEALRRALRNESETVPSISGVAIRLERARRSFEKGDLQFAAELVTQLDTEGHSDPEIAKLRRDIEEAVERDRTERLVAIANQYFESEEYTLALKKVQEVLDLAPTHPAGLALNARIETVLTEQKVSELLAHAKEHLERSAFTNARQAVQDALKLRPTDTRAREFLSLVDGKQKELLKHRQEQERLFQSAQSDWLDGNIEGAIAALDNLAEVSRRSNYNRERVNEYKEFYRRVRTELDELTASVDRARHLLAEKDYDAAQQICDRYLSRYPKHAVVQTLARDIAQLRQEEEARFEESIADRLKSEGLLDKRLEILEEALKVYPSNAFLVEEAQKTSKIQKEVEVLANDAHLLEKQEQFGQAVGRWQSLKEIYSAYPGIDEQIGRAAAALKQQREAARSAAVNQITAALEHENYASADRLLDAAEREFSEDPAIPALKAKRVVDSKRSEEVRHLLQEANRLRSQGKFKDAVAALARAREGSRGLKPSAARVSTAALKQAEEIVRHDWRAAQTILETVLGSENARAVAPHIQEEIKRQQLEEEVRGVLEAIGRDRKERRFADAQERAKHAAQAYPGDSRIQAILKSLETEVAEIHRRQERQNRLAGLARLKHELETSSSPPDLEKIVAQATSLAAPFARDREVDEAVRVITDQISSYQQASAALSRGDFPACRDLCAEPLKRTPDHQLFLRLNEEAEAGEHQRAAEYLTQVEDGLASEPLLERRAQILAEASQRYPNEPYFEQALALVKNKQTTVETVADRARTLQRNGSAAEALQEWKYLEEIYPFYPGLADSLAGCTRILEERRAESKRRLIADVNAALGKHDYRAALDGVQRALREFPGDSDLVRFEQATRERLDALSRAEDLLDVAGGEFVDNSIAKGFQTVLDALQSAKEEPAIRTGAAKLLLKHVHEALSFDLGLAEAMLAEAAASDPQEGVPKELTAALQQARRQDAFHRCSAAIEGLESSGDLAGALTAVREFLTQFPDDQQGKALESRLTAANELRQKAAERAQKIAELRTIEAATTTSVRRESLLEWLRRANELERESSGDAELRGSAQRAGLLLTALVEIRGLLDAGDFSAAHQASTRALEKFPDCAWFKDLQAESAFRQDEAAAEYLRAVEQKLEAESDFRRQMEILIDALRRYPEETYYQHELQLVQNNQALLDAAIARAREVESRSLYEDAKRRWEDVAKMYPWLPGVPSEIERITRLWAQRKAEAKGARMAQIRRLIEAGDCDAAERELGGALAEFPGDQTLRQLANQLANVREEQSLANSAFFRGEKLLRSKQIAEACDSLREAFRRSPPGSERRERVIATLITAAEERRSGDWHELALLLELVTELEPTQKIPQALTQLLDAARREDRIQRLLERISRAEADRDWDEGGRLLALDGSELGSDPRLEKARQSLEESRRLIELERHRIESLQAMDRLRSSLETTTKRKQLTKLRLSFEAHGWLNSEDEPIRNAAQILAQQLEGRIATLESTKPRQPLGVSAALSAGAVALISISMSVAVWIFMFRSRTVPVQFAVGPEQVSVTIGPYSCITPNCRLSLSPGHYEAHLAKDGYDSAVVPLVVDKGGTPVRLAAALTPSAPAVRIAGDLQEGEVTLDGSRIGALRDGHLDIRSMKAGQHILKVAQQEDSASIPFDWSQTGQPTLSGQPTAKAMTVVAVAESGNSGALATTSHGTVRVSLDGQSIGTAKDRVLALPELGSGYRKLAVSNEDEVLNFDLNVSRKPSLELFIVATARVGSVLATANVGDAQLTIDQKSFGTIAKDRQFRAIVPVGAHTLQAMKDGYAPSEVVHVSVSRGSEISVPLQLTALPGLLTVRGALAGTQIQLDHAAFGVVSREGTFKGNIPAGDHTIDLSRVGFTTKHIQRRVRPGEPVTLAGSDAELLPAPPSAIALESKDWERVNSGNSVSDLQAFVQKYPGGPHTAVAEQKLNSLAWGAVQKSSAPSIQQFLANYPQGPHTDEAHRLLSSLEQQRKLQFENTDWSSTDKSSPEALQGFLSKHPAGAHSDNAHGLLAQLEQRKAAQVDTAEEKAWSATDQNSRTSIESFLARFPSGKYQARAANAIAALGNAKQAAAESSTIKQPTAESTAVEAALKAFAQAWEAKDLDGIIAGQPSLNKRTLRGQLADVRSLQMTITPLSPPTVTGDRATVPCKRVVIQTFSDGSVRQNPSTVTFGLVKRGGRWIIDTVQ